MSGDLDKLLAAMRGAGAPAETRLDPNARTYDVGFDTLPEMQKIKLQRDFAAMTGLIVPYYREHAGRSGTHAMIEGHDLVNFASYDYLGLNGHPEVLAAARDAIDTYGTSVSASRISAGSPAG